MTSKRTLRQVAVALLLLVAFLFQGTWALAGTTGGVSGTVTDESGAPVAGATVSFTSPSENLSGKTDAGGRFSFLSLAPDTYTVSITKDGYNPLSVTGVTVFADNNQELPIHLTKALKTIAKVSSTAAGSLVKGGVGGDIYNVNAQTITAAQALGGGGNLNSAYSAISSVPGVNVPIGGAGWNQSVYIRGAQSYFTGFEYDGVPVNRAFDNYNASTESSLGLQELQVYTGGGPASNTSSGTSGFINQVIKTGTYPGYATASGGIASSAFYHDAKIEAGGATPDRNFSYYVGLSGYNQDFRFLDNNNGASEMGPGGIYSDNSYARAALPVATGDGAWSFCDPTTGATPIGVINALNESYGTTTGAPGAPYTAASPFCLTAYSGLTGTGSEIIDRENVVNFHFGIPRKNGQKDDVQLLWSASMLKTQFYSSVNDLGGYNAEMLALDGSPYVAGVNYPGYNDTYVYNEPFGTPVTGLTPTLYQQPDSPTGRAFDAQVPAADEDQTWNDQGIVKLQYTHPIGDRAYLRGDVYTFFSDWNLSGDETTNAAYVYGTLAACCANNYLLNTHTTGGELQFSDQINDKNLLQLTGNYTSARVLRDNNTTNVGAGNPYGIVSGNATSGFTCWTNSAQTVTTGGQTFGPDSAVPCYKASQGSALLVGLGIDNPSTVGIGPNAAAAGANLINLWSGGVSASYNTVDPKFLNLSLSDQFRPNDKWLINGALRYEDYTYDMPASGADAANVFWGSIAANNFCYNTTPGQQGIYTLPLLPEQFPPASPVEIPETVDCNAYIQSKIGGTVTGYVHPNGTVQDGIQAPDFTSVSPPSYNLKYWSARYSATYTQSPDTVWRFSGGRFVEPPISASVQYLNASGNNTSQWANFMGLGFLSSFHNTPAMTSAQYDGSLERHIRGTDVSFKLTPFYSFTNGYQAQSFIGVGYVTQVPVGRQRNYGAEFAISKGDFSKDGFSGSYALTYTNSKVQFQSGLVNGTGANQIGYFNTAISDYNQLAKGGAQNYPCFTLANPATASPGAGVGTVGVAQACGAGTIANPYFSAPAQGLLDPNGWYVSSGDVALPGVNGSLGLYDTPWVNTLIVNYRHDKWAVTPSLQLSSGSSYGSPIAVQGVDPRLCSAVDASQSTPQCNYTSLIGQGATPSGLLYVPNWETGSFDGIGQYHNPNILVGNLAFSYDVTPRVSVNLTMANLFHTCFGGTKAAWTAAYPAGSTVCGYFANGAYVSNYQLGAGYLTPGNPASYSAAANGTSLYPWQQQPYAPSTGAGSAGAIPPPFNAYLTINFKL